MLNNCADHLPANGNPDRASILVSKLPSYLGVQMLTCSGVTGLHGNLEKVYMDDTYIQVALEDKQRP